MVLAQPSVISECSKGSESVKTARSRDDELWFEDGTIIIIAQTTEFRVYKGHLARRTDVFKDMLSFPQPTRSAVSSEDDQKFPCPVVHVTDSARDWRIILRLMLSAEEQGLFSKSRPDPSFEVISACVRLGHKYQMNSIYGQAMDYLKGHFTDSLFIYKKTPTFMPPGFEHLKYAIGVVNLARLTEEDTILPTALWMCCRMGADIVSGFTYSDGERETLSSPDLGLCFVAKARLLQATSLAYMQTFADLPAGICALKDGDDRCRRALRELSDIKIVAAITMPNPMSIYKSTLPGADAPQLCKACATAITQRQVQRQRESWAKLPSLLGITVPGW